MKHPFKELPVVKPELKQLYVKIGEEKGLEKMLKDFYRRMQKDVLIGFFFAGKDIDAIALKQKEFVMRAMGATPSYSGKPPAQAHLQLPPILEGHFDRRLKILEQTLKDHGLNENDIKVWIGFENAFRSSIVKK
jgi:hemoglobin